MDSPRSLDNRQMAFPFRGLQEPLELREDELDRVQIRAVRRQVEEPRSRSRNRLPNAGNLVSTEVVHHHDVAWLKGRDQMAGYPAKEDLAVNGSINDQRRRQTCRTKRREERRRLPVAVGHAGQQTLALGRPPPRTSHGRLGHGAVVLSFRRSCLMRRTQDSLTSKYVATSRVLRPRSHAASTWPRNSFEYGFRATSLKVPTLPSLRG